MVNKTETTTTATITTTKPNKPVLQPLVLDRMDVQCADPELKREALGELFDHCMTPVIMNMYSPTSPTTSSSIPRNHHLETGHNSRPLSTAAVISEKTEMPTGLISPTSEPELSFYTRMYGDEPNNGGGTFADLRRKLYGGGDKQCEAS